jgi:hypothetical protein
MRRKQRLPKPGSKRTVTKFLWGPRTLSTSPRPYVEKETRWLERATWLEEFYYGIWKPVCWMDNEKVPE